MGCTKYKSNTRLDEEYCFTAHSLKLLVFLSKSHLGGSPVDGCMSEAL